MNVKKAKQELQKLREAVAPKRQSPEFFIRVEGETEAEALSRHGLEEWPEDARFIQLSRSICSYEGLRTMASVRKAKVELQKLKDIVKADAPGDLHEGPG